MARRNHLDDFTRGRMIGKLEEGRTVTSVAAEFGINKSVVSRAWKTFQTTGTAVRKVGGDRPKTTTAGDDRYIILQAKRGRRQSASVIAEQLSTPTSLKLAGLDRKWFNGYKWPSGYRIPSKQGALSPGTSAKVATEHRHYTYKFSTEGEDRRDPGWSETPVYQNPSMLIGRRSRDRAVQEDALETRLKKAVERLAMCGGVYTIEMQAQKSVKGRTVLRGVESHQYTFLL
ncbi:transposable element Tcb2 transposase [Trichonephila clavipes]|nr:transposable element Tcb2 transposase [Trichonephila clavipes]